MQIVCAVFRETLDHMVLRYGDAIFGDPTAQEECFGFGILVKLKTYLPFKYF